MRVHILSATLVKSLPLTLFTNWATKSCQGGYNCFVTSLYCVHLVVLEGVQSERVYRLSEISVKGVSVCLDIYLFL